MDIRHLRRHQLPNGHLHLVLGVGQRRRHRCRAHKLLPRGRHIFEQVQRVRQIVVLEIEGNGQRLRHAKFGERVQQLVQLVLLWVAQPEEAGPTLFRVLREELRGGQSSGRW